MESSRSKGDTIKQVQEIIVSPPIFSRPDAKVIKTPCKRSQNSDLKCAGKMTSNEASIHIKTTAQWPNSVHGLLTFDFDGVSSHGTGTLIGPNIVLTAGHNLHDFEEKVDADKKTMQFMPAVNGHSLPFSFREVDDFFVSPKYIKEKKEDYGVLLLKEPVGELTGYFGLVCLEQDQLQDRSVNVYGYPSAKVSSKSNHFEMWGETGKVGCVSEKGDEIDYFIGASEGHSGSGVWYQEGDDYFVYAVHVLGKGRAKRGTVITRAIYNDIFQWLEKSESNGKYFKLNPNLWNSEIDSKYVI